METMPAIESAAAWFNAKTVAHRLDAVDRVAVSIVDTRTAEGSTVRFYNADGFDALFDEKPVGVRHAEDGDSIREEPVDLFPFVDVQVGPSCEFGRRITATRPYSESEADCLL